jgi:hypothetical protein
VPIRRIVVFLFVAALAAAGPVRIRAQVVPPGSGTVAGRDSMVVADSAALADTAVSKPASSRLPVYLTVGLAFGRRFDACALCADTANIDSFSGRLELGKYLGHGLGVGVEANVWRKGVPGPMGADSTGADAPTTLSNTVGNGSLIFSWQVWHLWAQAGGGLAFEGIDFIPAGSSTADHAKGIGVGYTVGVGASLPVAGPLGVAFYANYSAGRYDLSSPTEVVRRNVRHDYLEAGMGITLR